MRARPRGALRHRTHRQLSGPLCEGAGSSGISQLLLRAPRPTVVEEQSCTTSILTFRIDTKLLAAGEEYVFEVCVEDSNGRRGPYATSRRIILKEGERRQR